jgi:hypothetical protein
MRSEGRTARCSSLLVGRVSVVLDAQPTERLGRWVASNNGFGASSRIDRFTGMGAFIILVPTLRVGMPSSTLRVVRVASREEAAERPGGHSHAESGNE